MDFILSPDNQHKFFPNISVQYPCNVRWTGNLKIEERVFIAMFATIVCRYKITIGEKTMIANTVYIGDMDHYIGKHLDKTTDEGKFGEVYIGRDCWIGANACILKGVKLGHGCVVGAGAVVTKSFPSGSIILGNPGKLLRRRK